MKFNIYFGTNPGGREEKIGVVTAALNARLKLSGSPREEEEEEEEEEESVPSRKKREKREGGGLKASKGSPLLAAFSKSEWIIRASFKACSFLKYGEGRALGDCCNRSPAAFLPRPIRHAGERGRSANSRL